MKRSDVKELVIVIGLGIVGVYVIESFLTATAISSGIH